MVDFLVVTLNLVICRSHTARVLPAPHPLHLEGDASPFNIVDNVNHVLGNEKDVVVFFIDEERAAVRKQLISRHVQKSGK